MKIAFGRAMTDYDGKPIMDKGEEVTLAGSCIVALNHMDERISGDEKVQRFNLSLKIHKQSGVVDVTIDEAKLLKDVCKKYLSTIGAGRANQMLEEEAKDPEK